MSSSRNTTKRDHVSLALVHHANQYVITNGYGDREGMGDLLGLGSSDVHQRGLLPLLEMHREYRIPLNLHLSGTLIETLAWHYPETFSLIKRLRREGLLELIGSTFSQNIMPFFSDGYNLRQMNEQLWLYRRHLGWDLGAVKTFWVPERVWDTEKLAKVLRSDKLANGGYRYALIDDRLLYSVGDSYAGSARERFDRETPLDREAFMPWEIADGHGLVILPISKELRYLIPPTNAETWQRLAELFDWLMASDANDVIAIYGDDLEKAAGAGSWNNLGLERYEQFLRWLHGNHRIRAVLFHNWVPASVVGARKIENGTFFELARTWKAGESYRGWYEDPNCFEHRQYLAKAEQALLETERRGADRGLLEMGWKHLLHCSYENSWHNLHMGELTEPMQLAPWAAALTSHARSCFIIATAAAWWKERDGAAHAELIDIDADGENEVVLKNDQLFAVYSPYRGGRLIYLFDLTDRSGRLVIGNISDDWNWQEELNRYMDCPRNHPGAFADVGYEHDQYEASISYSRGETVYVTLRNVHPESLLQNAEKQITLSASANHLCVRYLTLHPSRRLSTEFCLSPDYHRLLRHGRKGLSAFDGRDFRGWSNGRTRVWVRIDSRQSTIWDRPYHLECGHGLNLRATSFSRDFHIDLGVGTPPRRLCRSVMARKRIRRGEAPHGRFA